MGPGAVSEHLAAEFDAMDGVAPTQVLIKLVAHLVTVVYVFEHLGHFVDLVGSAFNFELLNEDFFVLPGYRSFIEEARTQLLRVLLEECVATVQATE